MQLMLRSNGQQAVIDMERAGDQVLVVGEYSYRPAQMARRVRRLVSQMWGSAMADAVLGERLTFEAYDGGRVSGPWADSGSFSPRSGSYVSLGRWDENGSVGIALHELAHEMHLRSGGYDDSDGVIREALAVLAERESGLVRSFEREPYYTASNLIGQLADLPVFSRQPFSKRWDEVVSLPNVNGLSDLVNFYLDKSERLGLAGWLKKLSDDPDVRDALLSRLSATSLRYSLDYRRKLIGNLVRVSPRTPIDQLLYLIDAIITLDRRYPNDDLGQILDFCFAPHLRQRRRLFAFG